MAAPPVDFFAAPPEHARLADAVYQAAAESFAEAGMSSQAAASAFLNFAWRVLAASLPPELHDSAHAALHQLLDRAREANRR